VEGRRVVRRLGEAQHVGRLWRRHRLDGCYHRGHHGLHGRRDRLLDEAAGRLAARGRGERAKAGLKLPANLGAAVHPAGQHTVPHSGRAGAPAHLEDDVDVATALEDSS